MLHRDVLCPCAQGAWVKKGTSRKRWEFITSSSLVAIEKCGESITSEQSKLSYTAAGNEKTVILMVNHFCCGRELCSHISVSLYLQECGKAVICLMELLGLKILLRKVLILPRSPGMYKVLTTLENHTRNSSKTDRVISYKLQLLGIWRSFIWLKNFFLKTFLALYLACERCRQKRLPR